MLVTPMKQGGSIVCGFEAFFGDLCGEPLPSQFYHFFNGFSKKILKVILTILVISFWDYY
jgi:hypothetical protein